VVSVVKRGEKFPKILQKGEKSKDSKDRERNDKGSGSIKILKHTSRGSKLINLYVASGCA
jgi:hypothetical protein